MSNIERKKERKKERKHLLHEGKQHTMTITKKKKQIYSETHKNNT